MHFGDMFGARGPLFFDVLNRGYILHQLGDLFGSQRGIGRGILQHDRPIVVVGHPFEHLNRNSRRRPRRCHGDDRVYTSLLRRPGKEQNLGQRDAGAAKDNRQPPIHFFEHGIQATNALFLAQKVKFPDHHRPDNAMLTTAATEIRRRFEIGKVNFIIWGIGGGEKAKTAFEMIKPCHDCSFVRCAALRRNAARTLGVQQFSRWAGR